jgi:branched-subunit amino acid transport protein
MTEVLMIAGMALVTVAVRYPVLALVGKIDLPQPVLRALRYVPPSILAAIILPELLYQDDQIYIAVDNSFLVAGIIAALVAWRTKNLLLTIVLGMLALWGWRALLSLV